MLNGLKIVAENLLRLQSSVLLVVLNSCVHAKFTGIGRLLSEINTTLWVLKNGYNVSLWQFHLFDINYTFFLLSGFGMASCFDL